MKDNKEPSLENKEFEEWMESKHKVEWFAYKNYPNDPVNYEAINKYKTGFLAGQESINKLPKTTLEQIITNAKNQSRLATIEQVRTLLENRLNKFNLPYFEKKFKSGEPKTMGEEYSLRVIEELKDLLSQLGNLKGD